MNRISCSILLFTSTLLPAAIGAHARITALESQKVQSGALLKISCDPSVLPIDYASMSGLLRTAGVARKAVEAVLERRVSATAEDEPLGRLTMEFADDPAGGVSFVYGLSEGGGGVLGGAPPATICILTVVIAGHDEATAETAHKIIVQTVNRLAAALESAGKSELRHIQFLQLRAHEELNQARQVLTRIQDQLRELSEKAGRADLSREAIVGELSDLQSRQRSIEMEFQMRHARRSAIQQQIAQIAERAVSDKQNVVIEQELERIVALRQKELRVTTQMVEREVASTQNLDQAQEKLAMARVQLAQHRRESAQSAGGDLLASFNAELARLSIDSVEMEAHLTFVRQQIAQLKAGNLLELADQYDRVATVDMPLARSALERAMARSEELNHQSQTTRRPSVTVIGDGD